MDASKKAIPKGSNYPTDVVKLVTKLRAKSHDSGGMAFLFGKVEAADLVTLDEFKAAARRFVINTTIVLDPILCGSVSNGIAIDNILFARSRSCVGMYVP